MLKKNELPPDPYVEQEAIKLTVKTEHPYVIRNMNVYTLSLAENNLIPQRGWMLQHLMGRLVEINAQYYTVADLEMRGAENIHDMVGVVVR